MLKSVDEVSSELGVSKTAIYNKLKLKMYKDRLVKKQGKIMIDEGLFNLIQDSLKVKSDGLNEKNSEAEKPYIAMDLESSFNLNEEFIRDLQNQIKEKDKQIAQLHDLLAKSQSLIENSQVLLKQEQDKEKNKTLQLEQHFAEVDEKLMDLREKMETKKQTKKNFFSFFKDK